MEGISVAESSKAKKAPKVLHHLEIHPKMGGGVDVQHHHASIEHKMESHPFEAEDGKEFHEHIGKHTGMHAHHEDLEEQGESEPDSYDKG